MVVEIDLMGSLQLTRGQNRVVFRNPRGLKRYYLIYQDLTDFVLKYQRSADGETWSDETLIYPPAGTKDVYCFDVKVRDTGSQLDIFMVFYNETDLTVLYMKGTVADAESAISWGAVSTVKSGIAKKMAGAICTSICRTATGRLVVAFTEDETIHGKDYRHTKLIGGNDDGAAPPWSGEIIWFNGNGGLTTNQNKDAVYVGLESFHSGDYFLIYARVQEPTEIPNPSYQGILDVETWNGSNFASPTTVQFCGPSAWAAWYLSAIVDDNDFLHVVYSGADSTNLYHKKGTSPNADGLTSPTLIVDNFRSYGLTLSIDRSADEIYAIYKSLISSTNFYYKKSAVDPISFGSEQTITYGDDTRQLSSSGENQEGSIHIAGRDNDYDVFYHELSTGVGPIEKALSETIGLADGFARVMQYKRGYSETIALTDSFDRVAQYYRALSEVLSVADGVDVNLVALIQKALSESIGLTDETVETVLEMVREYNETISAADSVETRVEFVKALSETLGITDEVATILEVVRGLSESIGVADAVDLILKVLIERAETIGLSDSVSTVMEFVKGYSETITVAEAVNTVMEYVRGLDETITLSDAVDAVVIIVKSLNEPISLSDTVNLVSTFIRGYDETLTISDSFARIVQYYRGYDETITVADAVDLVTKLVAALDETIVLTDSFARLVDYVRGFGETLTVGDVVSTVMKFVLENEETITITDEVLTKILVIVGLSETITFDDALTMDFHKVLSSSLTVSDSMFLSMEFVRAYSETLSIADSMKAVISAKVLLETFSILDVAAVRIPEKGVEETIVLSDAVNIIIIGLGYSSLGKIGTMVTMGELGRIT